TLAQLRLNVVTDSLRQRHIDDANIPGIGTKLKERLAAAGIVTAAAVNAQRIRAIEGIGDAKARELEDWATLHPCQAQAVPRPPPPAAPSRGVPPGTKRGARSFPPAASQKPAKQRSSARREKITIDSAARQAAVDKQSTLIDEQHDREYAAACQQFERDRQ